VEIALRAALHQAGTAALSQLLRFPEPAEEQRIIACPCGQQARYRELRSRRILTALGEVEITRPWYLCPHCHRGQFPADHELDIENTDFSRRSPDFVHSLVHGKTLLRESDGGLESRPGQSQRSVVT
jgi:hypothetical protein